MKTYFITNGQLFDAKKFEKIKVLPSDIENKLGPILDKSPLGRVNMESLLKETEAALALYELQKSAREKSLSFTYKELKKATLQALESGQPLEKIITRLRERSLDSEKKIQLRQRKRARLILEMITSAVSLLEASDVPVTKQAVRTSIRSRRQRGEIETPDGNIRITTRTRARRQRGELDPRREYTHNNSPERLLLLATLAGIWQENTNAFDKATFAHFAGVVTGQDYDSDQRCRPIDNALRSASRSASILAAYALSQEERQAQ